MSGERAAGPVDRARMSVAISDMLQRGYGLADEVFSDAVLDRAEAEMDGLRLMLPDEKTRGNGHRRTIFLEPKTFVESVVLSGRGVPTIGSMAREIEAIVRAEGAKRGIPLLANWRATKAVINKMSGTESSPAEIYPHLDPGRFSGVLVVVGFREATVQLNGGEPRPLTRNSLEVFVGNDLSKVLGIRQPRHTIRAHNPRYSTAFSHDVSPPLTLKSIVSTALKTRSSY